MRKQLYICRADHCGYDQYDEILVRALNKADAIDMAVKATIGTQDVNNIQVWTAHLVKPESGPCDVIMKSFNAG